MQGGFARVRSTSVECFWADQEVSRAKSSEAGSVNMLIGRIVRGRLRGQGGVGAHGRVRLSPATVGWTLSVLFHVGVGLMFLYVRLDGAAERAAPGAVPTGMVEERTTPLLHDPVVEDLQVEPLFGAELAEAGQASLPDLGLAGPDEAGEAVLAYAETGAALALGSVGGGGGYGSRFCGAKGSGEAICYVVDCSRSMIVALDYVRGQLRWALRRLRPVQYFDVIFYAGGEPLEMEPAGLIRASAPNRRRAEQFAESVALADVGSREAAARAVASALERALTVRNKAGAGADLVYLLTDGDYDHEYVLAALQRAQAARPQAARVNVIGCGNRKNEDFLRALAAKYGGQYRFVSDEELAGAGSAEQPLPSK